MVRRKELAGNRQVDGEIDRGVEGAHLVAFLGWFNFLPVHQHFVSFVHTNEQHNQTKFVTRVCLLQILWDAALIFSTMHFFQANFLVGVS